MRTLVGTCMLCHVCAVRAAMTAAPLAGRDQLCSAGRRTMCSGGEVAHLIFCKVPMKLVHLVKGHCVKELFVEGYREVVSANIQKDPSPAKPWGVCHLYRGHAALSHTLCCGNLLTRCWTGSIRLLQLYEKACVQEPMTFRGPPSHTARRWHPV